MRCVASFLLLLASCTAGGASAPRRPAACTTTRRIRIGALRPTIDVAHALRRELLAVARFVYGRRGLSPATACGVHYHTSHTDRRPAPYNRRSPCAASRASCCCSLRVRPARPQPRDGLRRALPHVAYGSAPCALQ